MPISLSTIAELSTIAGFVISLIAIVIALVQIRQIRKSQFAESRPYVYVTLDCDTSTGKPRVFLEFTNTGRSPAREVIVNFESGRKWNYVSKPSYPFQSESGISSIQPTKSIRYFIGELGLLDEFDRIRNEPISCEIKYRAQFSHQELSETASISLADLKFSKSTKPKSK